MDKEKMASISRAIISKKAQYVRDRRRFSFWALHTNSNHSPRPMSSACLILVSQRPSFAILSCGESTGRMTIIRRMAGNAFLEHAQRLESQPG